MVERTINVDQDLLAFAGDAFERRHKPRQIGRWQSKQQPVARPVLQRPHTKGVLKGFRRCTFSSSRNEACFQPAFRSAAVALDALDFAVRCSEIRRYRYRSACPP